MCGFPVRATNGERLLALRSYDELNNSWFWRARDHRDGRSHRVWVNILYQREHKTIRNVNRDVHVLSQKLRVSFVVRIMSCELTCRGVESGLNRVFESWTLLN